MTLHKGYYLLEMIDGVVTSRDGNHSRKTGVTKALFLWKQLNLTKPNAQYLGIKVSADQDVPQVFTTGDFAGSRNINLVFDKLLSDGKSPTFVVNEDKRPKVNESALATMQMVMRVTQK